MSPEQILVAAGALILWFAMQMIPTEEHHDPQLRPVHEAREDGSGS
jgi:hypothetical protein